MTSTYQYVILGAGRQGTAAAYDLARHGHAHRIVMADVDLEVARQAAGKVNTLTGSQVARPQVLDVRDPAALRALLEPADAALSAVPYTFNLTISQAAIDARSHLCDLGGHTPTVRQQLALDRLAGDAGVSLVPDCGMGPGLTVTLAAYILSLFDEPREVYLYDGGLPQNPTPPWNYQLTFHINGLTNEMDGQAVFLRDGEIAFVDTLSEPELIDIPSLGSLEADVTSGGTSTSPWSFHGQLQRYENKTLRYPGHFEWLRAYKALGLFSEQSIPVNGCRLAPRELFHHLLEPQITAPIVRDVAVIRAIGVGYKHGQLKKVTIDMQEVYDESTGFTAMERLTGWHAATMLGLQATGVVPPGALPVESAVSPDLFLQTFAARGIGYNIAWT